MKIFSQNALSGTSTLNQLSSVFDIVFPSIGCTLPNDIVYVKAKAEYMRRGYCSRKAHFAALGLMSGRSQGKTCKYFMANKQIVFERVA